MGQLYQHMKWALDSFGLTFNGRTEVKVSIEGNQIVFEHTDPSDGVVMVIKKEIKS